MKTIKQYAALSLVFLCIMAGGILLMLDYDTIKTAWQGLIGAFTCFGAGLYLGHVFDRKNMLPE
jgi:hypothetical protein